MLPSGLSPRVRGNRETGLSPCRSGGSIPACAGEPGSSRVRVGTPRVYPRVCGGTLNLVLLSASTIGLSPRVRGNPRSNTRACGRNRSIPACAGEPATPHPRHDLGGVYPRVCGGTTNAALRSVPKWGLSPRVRGNPLCRSVLKCERGSIPACAGEPSSPPDRFSVRRVYPRVCGGTRRGTDGRNRESGLSPRVRGNRPASLSLCLPRTVYPRVCGGTCRR